jgi:hypothetical protein
MRLTRGTALILLGIGLLVATLAAGAATAPDRTVSGVDAAGTPTPSPSPTPTPSPVDASTPDGTPTATPETTDAPTATPLPDRPQTLIGIQGGWTEDGSILRVDGSEDAWRDTRADGYFEVSMLDNGTIVAAFANESAEDCGDVGAPCAETGYRVIDPETDEILSEYTFPVSTLTNSEVHAVDATGSGGFVFTDMDRERVVVVENGTEVWEWRAESFYEAPADPTSRDWLHINDVDTIGDGHFLVSVRNANQILIVERGAGVVEVINEDTGTSDENCLRDGNRLFDADGDGDVRCGDPSVIREQHNPQWLGNGAVLVADSENDRVVELHRTDNGSWEPVWALREAGGLELDWPRDADRLPNGNTLVTDSLNRRVFEVNPQGELVWSIGTLRDSTGGPDIPYEADRLPFGEFAGGYDSGTPTPTDANGGTETDGDGADTATGDGTATVPDGTDTPPETETRTPLPRMTAAGSGDLNDTGSHVPGLSLAVAGLRGQFSWVPFWFAEAHLAVALLSVALVLGGGADTAWQRYRRD